jgi:hypothetical protein
MLRTDVEKEVASGHLVPRRICGCRRIMPIPTKFFWKFVENYCHRSISAAGRRNSFCMILK